MVQLLIAGGGAALAVGLGLTFPAVFSWIEQEAISALAAAVLSSAVVLVVFGIVAVFLGARWRNGWTVPAPVRAVALANLAFIGFCALELSDGLLRQHGRVFYWTTVLFVPSLLLLFGVAFGRHWAWWSARALTFAAVLWFAGLTFLIPFGDVEGSSGPVPWWGRMYMMGVSLVFVAVAAYAYRALGHSDARRYFSAR